MSRKRSHRSYLAPRARGRPLEPSAHLKQSVAFCDHVGKPLRGRQVLTEVLLIRLPGGVFLLYDSVIEGQSCQQIPDSRASGNTEPIPLVFASRLDADSDPRLSHFQIKTLTTRPSYSESGYQSDSSWWKSLERHKGQNDCCGRNSPTFPRVWNHITAAVEQEPWVPSLSLKGVDRASCTFSSFPSTLHTHHNTTPWAFWIAMDILRDYLDSYLAREFGHLETFSDYKQMLTNP